ncbi:MAG: hypothetical protein M1826_006181 [Phylliscum demangeonii]|nr:MAG: hypothetical protein M1826_006181 [Phylliscum demangeonii]
MQVSRLLCLVACVAFARLAVGRPIGPGPLDAGGGAHDSNAGNASNAASSGSGAGYSADAPSPEARFEKYKECLYTHSYYDRNLLKNMISKTNRDACWDLIYGGLWYEPIAADIDASLVPEVIEEDRPISLEVARKRPPGLRPQQYPPSFSSFRLALPTPVRRLGRAWLHPLPRLGRPAGVVGAAAVGAAATTARGSAATTGRGSAATAPAWKSWAARLKEEEAALLKVGL